MKEVLAATRDQALLRLLNHAFHVLQALFHQAGALGYLLLGPGATLLDQKRVSNQIPVGMESFLVVGPVGGLAGLFVRFNLIINIFYIACSLPDPGLFEWVADCLARLPVVVCPGPVLLSWTLFFLNLVVLSLTLGEVLGSSHDFGRTLSLLLRRTPAVELASTSLLGVQGVLVRFRHEMCTR